MEAILDADLPGRCAAVISNRPDAAGLAWAAARGVATAVVDHKAYADRARLRCRAGRRRSIATRRIWSCWPASCACWAMTSCDAYEGRLINIHPVAAAGLSRACTRTPRRSRPG